MPTSEIVETYRPRGNISRLFAHGGPEIILSGPAGTGKSRGNLEYQNYLAMTYRCSRHLMLRKTRRSLTESGMVTFEQKVLHPAQGVRWKTSVQQYQYPNGSILAVGGLDKPSKIMSSEWDTIYFQEATEGTEEDWESCSIRLRNGKTPLQQMLGDVNPGPASHWIRQRALERRLALLDTHHEDNPVLFDDNRQITEEGKRYIGRLDQLTGVRYKRYRLGLWVSAEGMIYEDTWEPARNIINPFPVPVEWPRYMAIDFGYTNPFACLWAAQDPDGRLYVYRQLYKTRTLVEDHARTIKMLSHWGERGGDPLPRAIICDHDAEDRATLERHLVLSTTPAIKNVSSGIQAVSSRFRPAGDGKPRVMIFRDCLPVGQRDRDLADSKKPTSLEEEPEGYIWDTRQGMKRGEQPVKEYDHGLDALRYLVAHFDLQDSGVAYMPSLYR